jgi:serine protease inhibitor
MQHSLSNSSIRTRFAKAFVVGLIALIVCTNLALTGGRAKNEQSQIPVDTRLTTAASKFSFKLYNDILQRRTGPNTFVSPASVMLALAMTYNGAAGTTRQAMARTLELEGMTLEEVNSAFANLKSALAPSDPKVQLKIANSLWAKREFPLNPAFVERNEKNFGAEIANLDFSDPAATDTINSWVTKNTEGKIQKIIERIKPEEVLFLINAIYFKGQWQFEFKKQNTKPDAFRVAAGGEKRIEMMSQSGNFFYYKGENFQSVALPYGAGRVSMYIFLPDEQTGLEQFEQSLTAENWDTWMKSYGFAPGDLMLPRFKVEWESELNKTLIALGMAEAFDPNRADFSLIPRNSGAGVFISEVRHKTLCEVNEEGTVAAAVTAVGASTTSYHKPPEKFVMKVDHPFFFVIRDNATGVLLFMGSVTNPG